MKSAKYCNCPEPFADSKGKALSVLLLFALQLTYMPSCINRITTGTRSAPGFLCQVPWSCLKKQAQGMHRKQTSPIEVPRWSCLLPPFRNTPRVTDRQHRTAMSLSCCTTTSLVELCEGSTWPQQLGEPRLPCSFSEPPRFPSSPMEMSYLHVSLVHSAWTSSGLPEAAGCFPPRFLAHTGLRGEKEACTPGSPRVPLSRRLRLQVARPEALGRACGLPGAVLRAGC